MHCIMAVLIAPVFGSDGGNNHNDSHNNVVDILEMLEL